MNNDSKKRRHHSLDAFSAYVVNTNNIKGGTDSTETIIYVDVTGG